MFAIILDAEGYVESYSIKFRSPESILVNEIPTSDLPKLQCYKYIDDAFVFDAEKWAEHEANEQEISRRDDLLDKIKELKSTLNSSDYQIIKCYEYSLNGLEMPYDVETLHADRQALRDEINALEKSI